MKIVSPTWIVSDYDIGASILRDIEGRHGLSAPGPHSTGRWLLRSMRPWGETLDYGEEFAKANPDDIALIKAAEILMRRK